MKSSALVFRSLAYYWRTNLAVIAGVATAVAVLAGALLVGDSVRGSLKDLVLQRLGRTDRIVLSSGFFREALADDLRQDSDFTGSYRAVCPLVIMQGLVADAATGRRASHVQVYGVDDRFWRFHGIEMSGPPERAAFVSRPLATEIGAGAGRAVLVRVERPSDIPTESLYGRKDDPMRALRLSVERVLERSELGEFSVQPQQGAVRAVFVPLNRIQRDLQQLREVNALLVSDRRESGQVSLRELISKHATLEDFGMRLREVEAQRAIALESSTGLLDSPRSTAVDRVVEMVGASARPVLTYLANTLRSGGHEVPYSLVTATDLSTIAPAAPTRSGRPAIIVNDWTARELDVRVGDPLRLEYYVWREPGQLETRTADFEIAGVVPIAGTAADRELAPEYPGITQAETLGDWDPPFPIDLKRVRPADEEYWKRYRTTPKAFISYDVGRRLWSSRFGDRTSVRILPPSGQSLTDTSDKLTAAFKTVLNPSALGFVARPIRTESLAASRGSTDFGEYFVYFSFFLVASALVLVALFFRLGVEQRAREVGLLRAVGFSTPHVRRILGAEGLLLAIIGAAIGVAWAVGYAGALMAGLRTWWSGAVGTTALTLHVTLFSLATGAVAAVVAAAVCVWWTLRGLARLSERSLLAGTLTDDSARPDRWSRGRGTRFGAFASALLGLALVVSAAFKVISPSGAFFGAGAAFLIAWLCMVAVRLRRSKPRLIGNQNWLGVAQLGIRNTAERPGRSVLAIAIIGSAMFILIAVDAFRRTPASATDRRSGTGGYSVLVDLMVPLVHDPNGRDGRELLGLPVGDQIFVEPFRLRPGDDTSCLNLYAPANPRILGVTRAFRESGRFSFEGALASNDSDRSNPWLLLNQALPNHAIPVITDANSLTYVLHKKLGDEVLITQEGREPVRLRLVAALADSIFQGELLMAEEQFVQLFPEQQGYRLLLLDTPRERVADVSTAIENSAADLGADAISTTERLARFHTVENTYLSTFQLLGGLGLLVGTVGLAAVLLRNVLERRRELALLRAVGYQRAHLFAVVLSENIVLLAWGLAAGTVSALVAIAPAAFERGARMPLTPYTVGLLLAVLCAGLISSLIATRAALRGSLLSPLRAE